MKAFPTPTFTVNDEARITSIGGEGGMDLRDYFAAKVMQAAISKHGFYDDEKQFVLWCYQTADAMLKAREA